MKRFRQYVKKIKKRKERKNTVVGNEGYLKLSIGP